MSEFAQQTLPFQRYGEENEVVNLDKDKQIATLKTGHQIHYDALITTTPLDLTLKWLGKPEIADRLEHRYDIEQGKSNQTEKRVSTHSLCFPDLICLTETRKLLFGNGLFLDRERGRGFLLLVTYRQGDLPVLILLHPLTSIDFAALRISLALASGGTAPTGWSAGCTTRRTTAPSTVLPSSRTMLPRTPLTTLQSCQHSAM